jgi:hypothetical protein
LKHLVPIETLSCPVPMYDGDSESSVGFSAGSCGMADIDLYTGGESSSGFSACFALSCCRCRNDLDIMGDTVSMSVGKVGLSGNGFATKIFVLIG